MEDFVVEDILEKRFREEEFTGEAGGEVEYLIKWDGLDADYNSWHTIFELHDFGVENPEELIDNFKKGKKPPKKNKPVPLTINNNSTNQNKNTTTTKTTTTNTTKTTNTTTTKTTTNNTTNQNNTKNTTNSTNTTNNTKNVTNTSNNTKNSNVTNTSYKKMSEAISNILANTKETITINTESDKIQKNQSENNEISNSQTESAPKKNKPKNDDDDSDSDDWEWVDLDIYIEEDIPAERYRPYHEEEDRADITQKKAYINPNKLKKQRYVCNAETETLREPVVVVLGHVDAGKTTLLDKLRNSRVQAGEAGGITQQIGATHIPIEHIKELTNELNENFNFELKLPGFLFIDTPGHESFSNMRVRGSSLCDMAVLVVDIKHGLQSQTVESLRLLIKGKTKFIVALNKVDIVPGWTAFAGTSFRYAYDHQSQNTINDFKIQLKKVRDQLAEHGVLANIYWAVKDLSVQVPIVPLTAINSCGIPDLLLFSTLYAQCLLTERIKKKDTLECSILEVQESAMGHTVDVLLINGELRLGEKLMICSLDGVITTQIRSLICTRDLHEMKGKGDKTSADIVKEVKAVRGIKIWAKKLDTALPGTNIVKILPKDDPEILKKFVMQQMDTIESRLTVGGSSRGVHVQASTIGSLEALLEFLNENGVPVGSYGLGQVNIKDVKSAMGQKLLLAFDVTITTTAANYAIQKGVDILSSSVIYELFHQFQAKRKKQLANIRESAEQSACILTIVPAYIVNDHDPLIIGVQIRVGRIFMGLRLYLHDKTYVGEIEVMKEVSTGKAVMSGTEGFVYIIQLSKPRLSKNQASVIYGRDFFEDSLMYSIIDQRSINKLQKEDVPHLRKILAKYRDWLGFPPYGRTAREPH